MEKVNKPTKENQLKAEDWVGFYNELQQESQRGAILIGAAFLDEHLRQLLVAFLVDKKTHVEKLLEGQFAPLGNFSSRICAAYCLGLITSEEFHDLEIIRGIRNEFAHALHGLSLEDEWMVKECNKLLYPKKFGSPWSSGSGNKLLIAISMLASWLKLRTLGTKHCPERANVKHISVP